jgi:rod shape-determining protein MreC
MLEFLRRNRVLASTLVVLAVGAALVIAGGGERLREDRLGRLFLEVMAPLQQVTMAVSRTLGHGVESLFAMLRARSDIEALRDRVRALQQTARLTEVELENERLRALLDFRETLAGDLLAARVIAHDATALSRTLTIDRGSADGVVKGAAVLAPAGIVGHVFLASFNAARVLLITDHNSGVDAVVQRTRARGIVEGTVDGHCGLKFVKRTEELLVGDLVVTSGLDGIFPRSTPIGRIVSVDKRGQGLFQYAIVEPAVDFDRLEEVLVARGRVEPLPELPPGSPDEPMASPPLLPVPEGPIAPDAGGPTAPSPGTGPPAGALPQPEAPPSGEPPSPEHAPAEAKPPQGRDATQPARPAPRAPGSAERPNAPPRPAPAGPGAGVGAPWPRVAARHAGARGLTGPGQTSRSRDGG